MRTRILVVSCAVILLCMSIITGISYALFTDSVSVENHLQAGNLDAKLSRTRLDYSVINDEGFLEEKYDINPIDFTGATSENIFGITDAEMLMVPGSYFKAQMEISNNGNVAFNYSVGIALVEGNEDFAKQLIVTFTDSDGNTETKSLYELTSGATFMTGQMIRGSEGKTFTVEVSFLEDRDTENDLQIGDNNNAMAKSVVFDLVVYATQATA